MGGGGDRARGAECTSMGPGRERAGGGGVWQGRHTRPDRLGGADEQTDSRGRARTSVGVGLGAVAVLEAVLPEPGVAQAGRALPHAAAPLQPAQPLAAVRPAALALHAQPFALALPPVALVAVPAGPREDAQGLEAVRPAAAVLALGAGPGAHAVAMCPPRLPAAHVAAPVVKVELAPGGHACSWRGLSPPAAQRILGLESRLGAWEPGEAWGRGQLDWGRAGGPQRGLAGPDPHPEWLRRKGGGGVVSEAPPLGPRLLGPVARGH